MKEVKSVQSVVNLPSLGRRTTDYTDQTDFFKMVSME